MQIINCTYRGPRARYYVSKPYPYYTADQLTVGMEALGGILKDAIISMPAEELTVGMLPLTSELRSLVRTYNVSTGAVDGSIPATPDNDEAFNVQIVPLTGVLVTLLLTHTQPTEAATVSLDALNGTLLQILITHTQPIEAVDVNLTALDGTLI